MKYPLYCIRDIKANNFGLPQADTNDQTAERNFSFAINQPDGLMNYRPQDYDLYRVGEVDTITGVITPLQVPEFITSGVNVFQKGV